MKKVIPAASMDSLRDAMDGYQYDKLPEMITLNFAALSPEEAFSLLEALRLKLQDSDVLALTIARARSQNQIGAFKEVAGLEPQNQELELLLEKARACFFLGDYARCGILIGGLLQNTRDLSLSSRAVVQQIHGALLTEKGEISEALKELESADRLFALSDNSLGRSSAILYQAKAFALLREFSKSDRRLKEAASLVFGNKNLRWILGYYRCRAQIEFLKLSTDAAGACMAGILLAQALGDRHHTIVGLSELLLMQEKLGSVIFVDAENARKSLGEVSRGHSPLQDAWVGIHGQGPSTELSWTLRELVRLPSIQARKGQWQPVLYSDFLAKKWMFDSQMGFALSLVPPQIFPLLAESPLAKMLITLNAAEKPVEMAALFERVWGLTWNPKLHANIVKVSASRIRKMGGCFSMKQKLNAFQLSHRGHIF